MATDQASAPPAPKELVVREAFGLPAGKSYDVGQHVTDPKEIAQILADRPRFVRAIDPDALKKARDQAAAPAKE